ncbi:MAG: TatD family hydrolase [Oscillospiraceae bacterium]|jgi:TatD DNase family protein|nr:TatD family hydrolase [Oscillospiraceae bacterium]
MRFFDTHAHYDDARFDADRKEILLSLPSKGVELVLNPGSDIDSSRRAVALAGEFAHVWAACGVHPGSADTLDANAADMLSAMLKDKKCVALGEVGFDYHYDTPGRDVQKRALYAQLQLAAAHNVPVIFHDRDAHADSLRAIDDFPGLRGVFHCFSGSAEMARELVKKGWYISFTGVITFPNARRVREAATAVPRGRVMIETDAPYLAPQPWRGARSDSTMLTAVTETLAGIWGVGADEAAEITFQNGVGFFGIPTGVQGR